MQAPLFALWVPFATCWSLTSTNYDQGLLWPRLILTKANIAQPDFRINRAAFSVSQPLEVLRSSSEVQLDHFFDSETKPLLSKMRFSISIFALLVCLLAMLNGAQAEDCSKIKNEDSCDAIKGCVW